MKLFVSVLAAILVILCVAFTSAAAVADKDAKVLVSLPTSFNKDPSIVRVPPMLGLPFGDFSQVSEAEIKETIDKFFPMITSNFTRGVPKDQKEAKTNLKVELIRWATLENALKFRNQPGDEKFLKVMLPSWLCPACKFAVEKLEDYLNDGGCDLASDVLGDICAAIPIVGAWTVPECVAVLKWGCSKILALIEDHITSSATICNDVFGLSCSDGVKRF